MEYLTLQDYCLAFETSITVQQLTFLIHPVDIRLGSRTDGGGRWWVSLTTLLT